MRKLKIYLDTSVISYLEQPERGDRHLDTLRFWEDVKADKYEVFISALVLEEIANCKEPKKTNLFNRVNGIKYNFIENVSDEVDYISSQIIETGILNAKNLYDCAHIATAIIARCDIIVSWNFKHMVNRDTINGVKAISLLNRCDVLEIYSPAVLLKGED
ncbi:hypothetical protein AGMMS49975_01550 [Clostridia bacterium]|nr:hypothetical protein AGMMS49975_01550 [Clostridia bacterium]